MDDEFGASFPFSFEEVRFGAKRYFDFWFCVVVLIVFECIWIDDIDFSFVGGIEDGWFGIFFSGEIIFFTGFFTIVILCVDIFFFFYFTDLVQADVTLLKGLFDIII